MCCTANTHVEAEIGQLEPPVEEELITRTNSVSIPHCAHLLSPLLNTSVEDIKVSQAFQNIVYLSVYHKKVIQTNSNFFI